MGERVRLDPPSVRCLAAMYGLPSDTLRCRYHLRPLAGPLAGPISKLDPNTIACHLNPAGTLFSQNSWSVLSATIPISWRLPEAFQPVCASSQQSVRTHLVLKPSAWQSSSLMRHRISYARSPGSSWSGGQSQRRNKVNRFQEWRGNITERRQAPTALRQP